LPYEKLYKMRWTCQ